MVIQIEGINKLVGKEFQTRIIQKITNAKRYGEKSDSYVFHFSPILVNRPKPQYQQWEDSFEVYLSRYPNPNGIYELFWMGLHGVTCVELYKEDIKNFPNFMASIGVVVGRGKQYWESIK